MKPCRALRPRASAPDRTIALPDITWPMTSGTETTPMRGAVSKADDRPLLRPGLQTSGGAIPVEVYRVDPLVVQCQADA